MKKQETVIRNFEKNVELFERTRNEKIANIEKTQVAIITKITQLKSEFEKLELAKTKIIQQEAPKAPSEGLRSQQVKKSQTNVFSQ